MKKETEHENSIEEHSIFRVNILKNFLTKEDSKLKLNFKKMYSILFYESSFISKQLIFSPFAVKGFFLQLHNTGKTSFQFNEPRCWF